MAQFLRAVLSRDLGSIPTPTMEQTVPGDPNPLLTSMDIRSTHGTHIHAGKIYIKLNKQN